MKWNSQGIAKEMQMRTEYIVKFSGTVKNDLQALRHDLPSS